MLDRRIRSRIGRYLLGGSVVGAAMALGGIHTSVLCVVGLLVGAAAVLAWWGAERVLVRHTATVVVVTGIALTAYTLLQAIPLPASLVAALSPHAAEIWSRALAPLHEAGPSWITLSLDPIATRIEVLRGTIYVAAFIAALKIASRRDGGVFLANAVILGGALMAVAAIAHASFGLTKVYCFYGVGERIDSRHVAPLLNPNHLAAYLNVAFAIALAAAVARDPSVPRAMSIGAVLLLAGTQLWVASRGGVLSMGIAIALVLWMSRSRVADRRATTVRTLPLLAVAIASLAMIVYGASHESVVELTDTDTGKLGAVYEMGRMIPKYVVFGAGRGAFESTFPEFRDGTTHATFTHPETILVQWPSEWGVVVAGAAAAALAFALWPRASVVRSHASVGAWVALVVTGVHNLVDFSSEIPGVAIALAVCAAMVLGGAPDHPPRTRFARWSLRPRLPAIGIGAATVMALAVAAPSIGRDLGGDRETLRVLALAPGTSMETMHATARAAMLRHPSEPYLPFAVALRASYRRDESVVPWVGRVFDRAHVYAPAHLLLARAFVRASPAQARMEYRMTLEQEPELLEVVLREAPRLVGSIDDAMELVPAGAGSERMLDSLVDTIAIRLPGTAMELNAKLLERTPNAPRAVARAATWAVEDLERGDSASICAAEPERGRCRDKALALSARLQKVSPMACAGFELEARARLATGEGTKALDLLRDVAGRVTNPAACLRALVTLAVKIGDPAAITRAVDAIVHAGCVDDAECAHDFGLAIGVEESRGNLSRALAICKRAHERLPEDDAFLARSASLASRLNMHAEAMQSYEALARRHPDDGQWAAAAAREKTAIVSGMRR